MTDLMYHGERSDVIEYLTCHGWDVHRPVDAECLAANGFAFPEDGAMGFLSDMNYLTAVRR